MNVKKYQSTLHAQLFLSVLGNALKIMILGPKKIQNDAQV